jgi:predicted nucleic acid-binding Zn ribbon protein
VKRIGDLLKLFMQERGWANGNPYDPLFKEWGKIAGGSLSAHSRLVDVQKGILLVEVDHPGWLQLAQLRKAALLEAAKRVAPLASIDGIRFRVGAGDGAAPEPPRPAEGPPH